MSSLFMHKRVAFFSLFLLLVFMIIPVNFASAQYGNPCDSFYSTSNSKEAKELIACFENNPTLVNDYPEMAYWIASAYHQLKDYDNAIYYYKLDLERDDRALASLCYTYLDMKDYSSALEYGNKAVSLGYDGVGTTICIDYAEMYLQEEMEQKAAEAAAEVAATAAVAEEQKAAEQKIAELEAELEEERGGGCLIATATFGSEMAPQVQFLRELRDNTVLQTESGSAFMTGFNQFYYSFSPYVADYERENPAFKETVKIALTPLLTSLTLLQYVDIDSESEMLGYGIGVILLNIGMYFVAPAVLIMAVRKRI